jgi:hypothetical protein
MATKKKSPAKSTSKKGAKTPVKSDRWKSKKGTKGKKPRKLGGWWLIANIFAFGLVIGTAIVIYFGPTPDRTPPPEPVTPTREVTIYFGSTDGETLRGVERTVDEGILSNEIAGAVELLLGGPNSIGSKSGSKKLERTVPTGTRLLGVRVTGSTAVVNLSRELITGHGGGTSAEMQTVYSIVNTVALGWPEVRDVQLLVEGNRVDTVAGHIDIKQPIRPNRAVNTD